MQNEELLLAQMNNILLGNNVSQNKNFFTLNHKIDNEKDAE